MRIYCLICYFSKLLYLVGFEIITFGGLYDSAFISRGQKWKHWIRRCFQQHDMAWKQFWNLISRDAWDKPTLKTTRRRFYRFLFWPRPWVTGLEENKHNKGANSHSTKWKTLIKVYNQSTRTRDIQSNTGPRPTFYNQLSNKNGFSVKF